LTGSSEYVPRRYDSKQMALGEPKHVLWQSLESVHIRWNQPKER